VLTPPTESEKESLALVTGLMLRSTARRGKALTPEHIARMKKVNARLEALATDRRGLVSDKIFASLRGKTLKEIEILQSSWTEEPSQFIDVLEKTVSEVEALTDGQAKALVEDGKASSMANGIEWKAVSLTP